MFYHDNDGDVGQHDDGQPFKIKSAANTDESSTLTWDGRRVIWWYAGQDDADKGDVFPNNIFDILKLLLAFLIIVIFRIFLAKLFFTFFCQSYFCFFVCQSYFLHSFCHFFLAFFS